MASANTLKLELATPKGLALSLDVASVQAPSVAGEFGVLPGHLPVLAALQCGVVTYVGTDGKSISVAIDRGFAEAGPEKVLILTEAVARPEDVDVEATRAQLATAEKALAAVKDELGSAAYQEALRDMQWAEARLRVAAH